MKCLIKKGGSLITIMFPHMEKEGGPAFGVSKQAYHDILAPEFVEKDGPRLLDDSQAHRGRVGITWWCRWERV